MTNWDRQIEEGIVEDQKKKGEQIRKEESEVSEDVRTWLPNSLAPEEERPVKTIETVTGETKHDFEGKYNSVRDFTENAAFEDFRLASLTGEDFSKGNFTGKDFVYSDLRKTSFEGSSLEGADLRGADLRGTDLTGANLRRARFDEHTKIDRTTKLNDADVEGADLVNLQAEGLSKKQINSLKNFHLSKYMED